MKYLTIARRVACTAALVLMSGLALGAEGIAAADAGWQGMVALALFVAAYGLVIGEESLHLRKSKPMIVAAGFIWLLVAGASPDTGAMEELFGHSLLEFAELFLFLLAAMTYINTMEERGVFNLLRVKLMARRLSQRQIFWLTGVLAFCLSPVADNLTTALLLSAVILRLALREREFIVLGCINIVVAANAGGAFSPFGDITTLMVWQSGEVTFSRFFLLLVPSVVNWLVPAALMSLAIPRQRLPSVVEQATLQRGAWVVVGLFLCTLVLTVLTHNFLHLPPVLGMMTGLGFLKLFGYYLQRSGGTLAHPYGDVSPLALQGATHQPYDIYRNLERAEWDTLLFFYGIILCVGGLGAFGYLALGSELLYDGLGQTTANVLVGVLSAIIDNIPVMFAVLQMNPDMSEGQWLLVTLTAGVGGSMLSIGSAAGVAVMGQARGTYTFFAHLRWSWAIALGYVASIATHMWLNAGTF